MKRTSRKLELKPQTIRDLLAPDLKKVVGGMQADGGDGDSGIVPRECTGKLSGCGPM